MTRGNWHTAEKFCRRSSYIEAAACSRTPSECRLRNGDVQAARLPLQISLNWHAHRAARWNALSQTRWHSWPLAMDIVFCRLRQGYGEPREKPIHRRRGARAFFLASSLKSPVFYGAGHVVWHPLPSCHDIPLWVTRQSKQVLCTRSGTPLQLELCKKQ